MKAELLIAWRYLATRRKEKFISLISVISILGVAIGVAALIVVLAVMSGFDRDLRDKIVGNYSHITIAAYQGIDPAGYNRIGEELNAQPHVRGFSPYVQGQMLVREGERLFAVGVRGVNPATEKNVTRLSRYMWQGNIENLADGTVILGKELALYLGVGLNSNLNIYSPLGRQYNLRVVGIFNSGMYDYDMNLSFVNLKTGQEILGLGDKVSAVAVKLDNLYLAQKVKRLLAASLGREYAFSTWSEANRNFFAALKLEKLTMFVILTLIVLVASFNIISTLIVMVVEKTKDIGILKAIGMPQSGIRRIFVYQGLLIGTLGTLSGALIGIALCALLKKYQFIKLPQDIYYIERLPVAIQVWPDIALIVMAAIIITLASTVYPAVKAAGLRPVEALRYE
ncbi:MAG: ABC transporter permease [Candidatus Omnitrophota bacterium]